MDRRFLLTSSIGWCGENQAGLEVVVVLAFQFEAAVIGLDDILDNREAEAGAVHVFVQPVPP